MFGSGKKDLPNPATWVGCPFPLPPPPCVSSPAPRPLFLGQAVAVWAISRPQSGAGRGRPLNTGCLLCPTPQEHRLLIVWRKLQVGSKLLLKPSACHLAWIVTIVRPQQLFVSDSLSLFASRPSPTPPRRFALRRVERLGTGGREQWLGSPDTPKHHIPSLSLSFPSCKRDSPFCHAPCILETMVGDAGVVLNTGLV